MNRINDYTDGRLMEELIDGNILAFDVIYYRYSKRIFKFAYSILKSSDESDNIVQDVFMILWENRNNIQKKSSLKSYLFSVTYNSVVSIMRRKASNLKFLEYLKTLQNYYQDYQLPEQQYSELHDKLTGIINALPERQREVYTMHKIGRLKYKEISKRLNISVNTVANHMSTALKNIRKRM